MTPPLSQKIVPTALKKSNSEKALLCQYLFFLGSDLKILSFISCIIGRAFLFLFLRRRKKMLVKLLFFSSFLYPWIQIRIHITALITDIT